MKVNKVCVNWKWNWYWKGVFDVNMAPKKWYFKRLYICQVKEKENCIIFCSCFLLSINLETQTCSFYYGLQLKAATPCRPVSIYFSKIAWPMVNMLKSLSTPKRVEFESYIKAFKIVLKLEDSLDASPRKFAK